MRPPSTIQETCDISEFSIKDLYYKGPAQKLVHAIWCIAKAPKDAVYVFKGDVFRLASSQSFRAVRDLQLLKLVQLGSRRATLLLDVLKEGMVEKIQCTDEGFTSAIKDFLHRTLHVCLPLDMDHGQQLTWAATQYEACVAKHADSAGVAYGILLPAVALLRTLEQLQRFKVPLKELSFAGKGGKPTPLPRPLPKEAPALLLPKLRKPKPAGQQARPSTAAATATATATAPASPSAASGRGRGKRQAPAEATVSAVLSTKRRRRGAQEESLTCPSAGGDTAGQPGAGNATEEPTNDSGSSRSIKSGNGNGNSSADCGTFADDEPPGKRLQAGQLEDGLPHAGQPGDVDLSAGTVSGGDIEGCQGTGAQTLAGGMNDMQASEALLALSGGPIGQQVQVEPNTLAATQQAGNCGQGPVMSTVEPSTLQQDGPVLSSYFPQRLLQSPTDASIAGAATAGGSSMELDESQHAPQPLASPMAPTPTAPTLQQEQYTDARPPPLPALQAAADASDEESPQPGSQSQAACTRSAPLAAASAEPITAITVVAGVPLVAAAQGLGITQSVTREQAALMPVQAVLASASAAPPEPPMDVPPASSEVTVEALGPVHRNGSGSNTNCSGRGDAGAHGIADASGSGRVDGGIITGHGPDAEQAAAVNSAQQQAGVQQQQLHVLAQQQHQPLLLRHQEQRGSARIAAKRGRTVTHICAGTPTIPTKDVARRSPPPLQSNQHYYVPQDMTLKTLSAAHYRCSDLKQVPWRLCASSGLAVVSSFGLTKRQLEQLRNVCEAVLESKDVRYEKQAIVNGEMTIEQVTGPLALAIMQQAAVHGDTGDLNQRRGDAGSLVGDSKRLHAPLEHILSAAKHGNKAAIKLEQLLQPVVKDIEARLLFPLQKCEMLFPNRLPDDNKPRIGILGNKPGGPAASRQVLHTDVEAGRPGVSGVLVLEDGYSLLIVESSQAVMKSWASRGSDIELKEEALHAMGSMRAVRVILNAGDIIIFDGSLVHAGDSGTEGRWHARVHFSLVEDYAENGAYPLSMHGGKLSERVCVGPEPLAEE